MERYCNASGGGRHSGTVRAEKRIGENGHGGDLRCVILCFTSTCRISFHKRHAVRSTPTSLTRTF